MILKYLDHQMEHYFLGLMIGILGFITTSEYFYTIKKHQIYEQYLHQSPGSRLR